MLWIEKMQQEAEEEAEEEEEEEEEESRKVHQVMKQWTRQNLQSNTWIFLTQVFSSISMLVLLPTTWISQIGPSHQYSLKVMVDLMMSIGLIEVLFLIFPTGMFDHFYPTILVPIHDLWHFLLECWQCFDCSPCPFAMIHDLDKVFLQLDQ